MPAQAAAMMIDYDEPGGWVFLLPFAVALFLVSYSGN